jgi:hypothetical protein
MMDMQSEEICSEAIAAGAMWEAVDCRRKFRCRG